MSDLLLEVAEGHLRKLATIGTAIGIGMAILVIAPPVPVAVSRVVSYRWSIEDIF